MTPETLNPGSARFDFMKWVSLHHKDIPLSDNNALFNQGFLNLLDDNEEGEQAWDEQFLR